MVALVPAHVVSAVHCNKCYDGLFHRKKGGAPKRMRMSKSHPQTHFTSLGHSSGFMVHSQMQSEGGGRGVHASIGWRWNDKEKET